MQIKYQENFEKEGYTNLEFIASMKVEVSCIRYSLTNLCTYYNYIVCLYCILGETFVKTIFC